MSVDFFNPIQKQTLMHFEVPENHRRSRWRNHFFNGSDRRSGFQEALTELSTEQQLRYAGCQKALGFLHLYGLRLK